MTHDDDEVGGWVRALETEVAARVFGRASALSFVPPEGDEPLKLCVFLDAEDLGLLADMRTVVTGAPEGLRETGEYDLMVEHEVDLHALLLDLVNHSPTRETMLAVATAFESLAQQIRDRTLGHPTEPL
jgi:hypothetical protein